jgi:hypothetical protein
MIPTWRDHVANFLSTMVYVTICGLMWGLPARAIELLAVLCALGSAAVLGVWGPRAAAPWLRMPSRRPRRRSTRCRNAPERPSPQCRSADRSGREARQRCFFLPRNRWSTMSAIASAMCLA